MSNRLNVLVIGATGALGRPAVQMLLERGAAVRALSRHPDQAGDLAALGAEVVGGDLTDPTSLVRACAGMQRVLTAAHGFMGRGRWRSERVDIEGHRALFAAAREAGVERIVHTSGYGASPTHPVDFFRHKFAAEQALKASGLHHVILRPTAFMEHHAHNFNGRRLLEKGKAQLIGPATKPRNFVAAGDVAEFAVRALLQDPPPFHELAIGGPGNFSNLDVARLYARLAGIEPRIGHLPLAAAKFLSFAAAPLHPGLARVMRINSLPDEAFDERFDAAALECEHRVAPTRLEDFVRSRVAAAGITPRS